METSRGYNSLQLLLERSEPISPQTFTQAIDHPMVTPAKTKSAIAWAHPLVRMAFLHGDKANEGQDRGLRIYSEEQSEVFSDPVRTLREIVKGSFAVHFRYEKQKVRLTNNEGDPLSVGGDAQPVSDMSRLKLCQEEYDLLRRRVLERDGWRRQICGSSKNLQVHHLKFRSKLGDDELSNLISLCVGCSLSATQEFLGKFARCDCSSHRTGKS